MCSTQKTECLIFVEMSPTKIERYKKAKEDRKKNRIREFSQVIRGCNTKCPCDVVLETKILKLYRKLKEVHNSRKRKIEVRLKDELN